MRALALLLLLLFISACGQSSPPPPQGAAVLDRSLSLWLEGNREGALVALRETRFDDPHANFTHPLLTISEREFARKPEAERERLAADALLLAGHLRELSRAAMAERNRLLDEGNKPTAEQLLNAIAGLAAHLQDPRRRLAIFDAIGKSIQNYVDQHRIPGG
jgi:hypothetical protein